MITRYEVAGAGGLRLAAWEYGAAEERAAPGPGSAAGPDGWARAWPRGWDVRAGAGPGAGSGPGPGVGGGAGPGAGPGAWAEPAVPELEPALFPVPAAERPGVLLLHGLLGRASQWAETARRLAPRYRALALDLRGHGRSDKPEGPYTPEAHVADAIAAVEQLDLAPAVLVGHGMGALVAWQCAARRPDLVAAVVICDMRASAQAEAGQRAWAQWLGSWPLPFATLADVRRWFAAEDPWAERPSPARGDFFAEAMAEGEDGWRPLHRLEHMLRSRDPWIGDAHWEELARVHCPALVVRGVDGELGRAEAQEMVRVLPRGSYAEIPDAGHLVPWEQPAAWCEAVERFVQEALAPRVRAGSAGSAASSRAQLGHGPVPAEASGGSCW